MIGIFKINDNSISAAKYQNNYVNNLKPFIFSFTNKTALSSDISLTSSFDCMIFSMLANVLVSISYSPINLGMLSRSM